jgi:hypothetical protein
VCSAHLAEADRLAKLAKETHLSKSKKKVVSMKISKKLKHRRALLSCTEEAGNA